MPNHCQWNQSDKDYIFDIFKLGDIIFW
jgi:hypothetical protein